MDTRIFDAFLDANAWIVYLKLFGFQVLGVFVYFIIFFFAIWKVQIKELTRNRLLALKVIVPVCLILFYTTGYLALCFESVMLPLGIVSFLLLHITAIFYKLTFQNPHYFIEYTLDFKYGKFGFLALFLVWLTVEFSTFLFRPRLLPPKECCPSSYVLADFILGLVLMLAHCAVVPLIIEACRFALSPQLIIWDKYIEIGRYIWSEKGWKKNMWESNFGLQQVTSRKAG